MVLGWPLYVEQSIVKKGEACGIIMGELSQS
jgi:hypothetical protein